MMNKSIVYIALFINALHLATGANPVEAYYWRDFTGVLPPDALQGGEDKQGNPIYIGQVLFEGKLVPGKIYSNDVHIYFHWDIEQKRKEDVKILCTKSPKDFQWVPTKLNELTRLTNKLLIKGGFQTDCYTYIGRVFIHEEMTIGKLVCGFTACPALYVTRNGQAAEYKDPIQVLIYSPREAVKRNPVQPIDVRIWD